ncbi:MAG: class I SAM-dependent methyltransferase [bacterium]
MVKTSAAYDRIGVGYTATRRPDPRIAAQIEAALSGCASVVNVGAGSGSYEPTDRRVVAVELAATMIAQRPPHAAPCLRGRAEALPLRDGACDAALSILSLHHWSDWRAGLAEMRRVGGRVVLLTFDPQWADRFWFTRDYLPEGIAADVAAWPTLEETVAAPPGAAVHVVPIPRDCFDGFYCAYWARPAAYLDADVRRGMSIFARVADAAVARAVAQLRDDLASGAWQARYPDLQTTAARDLGYRLVVA